MSVMRDIVYGLVGLLTSPLWGYRMLTTGKWRTDWAGRFGQCAVPADTSRPTLLIHAVSVGEVKAVGQLVDQLSAVRPELRIIISVTTDTGIAQAKALYEPKHTVTRYPLDFSFSVRRFLDTVQPTLVALTELEVWPNFVEECHHRGIPVCVINGRLSPRGFKRYKLIAPLLRGTFGRLNAVAAQTQTYAERFITMGVPADRVRVLDTMKWDTARLMPAESVQGATELAQAMGLDRTRPIIVAGSTAPGEDELLINTCPRDAQLVIVPRKPEWFDRVVRIAPHIVRRSDWPDGSARPRDRQRLFLLDTMGELGKAYALADVVVVGRSFLGMYGSDVMEPIALGKPTVIGPHHSDFADTVAALLTGEGIIVTAEPALAARELLRDRARADRLAQNGQKVILARQGATKRHTEMLLQMLANPSSPTTNH